jgi:WD40 repeat protein
VATGSTDRTVRIWDTATGRIQALMRIDDDVEGIAWLGISALVIDGPAGLYLFDFLTDTNNSPLNSASNGGD